MKNVSIVQDYEDVRQTIGQPLKHVLKSVIVMVLFLGSGNASAGDDSLFRLVNISSPTGLEIGRGFDILNGAPRGDCVSRTVEERHANFGPNSVSFSSTKIENSTQLDKTLGVSASASVNTGFGSGSAAASFSNSLSIATYSLNYVVRASVAGRGTSIRDVKLLDKYQALLTSGDPDAIARFRTICGDGYVGEFTMGGELQAVIQVRTKSQAETETASASLSASFGMASGTASFSSALKKASQNYSVQIWTFQRGGGGPIPISPDDLTKKASELAEAVQKAPTTVEAAVFSYILLLDDPKFPFPDFETRERMLSTLSEHFRHARDQQGDAEYILARPSEFYSSPVDLPRLAAEIKALKEYRALLQNTADKCAKNSGNCDVSITAVPAPLARPARR